MGKKRGQPYLRTAVGLGDWSQTDSGFIKGHPKGPVKAFKTELKRHATLVQELDEFRTSKCCAACGQFNEMCRVKRWKRREGPADEAGTAGPRWVLKETRDYDFLRCSNNECGRSGPRDLNSAVNHRTLMEHWLNGKPRPAYLQRPTQEQRVATAAWKESEQTSVKQRGTKRRGGPLQKSESVPLDSGGLPVCPVIRMDTAVEGLVLELEL